MVFSPIPKTDRSQFCFLALSRLLDYVSLSNLFISPVY